MEILSNIWSFLTTENETFVNIMNIPLAFIEAYVEMSLFSAVLNIHSEKKQKILYILFSAILGIFCAFLIPKPYSNIITILAVPIAIKFILVNVILFTYLFY